MEQDMVHGGGTVEYSRRGETAKVDWEYEITTCHHSFDSVQLHIHTVMHAYIHRNTHSSVYYYFLFAIVIGTSVAVVTRIVAVINANPI